MDIDEILARSQVDLFWVPDDVRIVSRPEILYLACVRDESYLNVVLRLQATDEQMSGLIDEVDAAHSNVGSRWMLSGLNQRSAVEAPLEKAGYRPSHEHFAYSIRVDAYRPRPSANVSVRPVRGRDELRAWLEVGARAFGLPADFDDDRLSTELTRASRQRARVHRFVAYDDRSEMPVSAGALTIFPDDRFGLLWGGGTMPEARGRGAYAALVAARIERASELGIEAVGLYARVGTSAPIVEHQGFERHGPMTYWSRAARLVCGPLQ